MTINVASRLLHLHIKYSPTQPPISQSYRRKNLCCYRISDGAINFGPAEEVAHMEMNAEAAILKARLVEIRRRLENLLRDKLQFMHLFFVMGPFREGGLR